MKNTESVNFRWKSIFAYSICTRFAIWVLFGWCLYILDTKIQLASLHGFSVDLLLLLLSVVCFFFWLLVRCKWYYIFKSCAFIWFSQKRCFIVSGALNIVVVHVSVNMHIHAEEGFVGLFPPFIVLFVLYIRSLQMSQYILCPFQHNASQFMLISNFLWLYLVDIIITFLLTDSMHIHHQFTDT